MSDPKASGGSGPATNDLPTSSDKVFAYTLGSLAVSDFRHDFWAPSSDWHNAKWTGSGWKISHDAMLRSIPPCMKRDGNACVTSADGGYERVEDKHGMEKFLGTAKEAILNAINDHPVVNSDGQERLSDTPLDLRDNVVFSKILDSNNDPAYTVQPLLNSTGTPALLDNILTGETLTFVTDFYYGSSLKPILDATGTSRLKWVSTVETAFDPAGKSSPRTPAGKEIGLGVPGGIDWDDRPDPSIYLPWEKNDGKPVVETSSNNTNQLFYSNSMITQRVDGDRGGAVIVISEKIFESGEEKDVMWTIRNESSIAKIASQLGMWFASTNSGELRKQLQKLNLIVGDSNPDIILGLKPRPVPGYLSIAKRIGDQGQALYCARSDIAPSSGESEIRVFLTHDQLAFVAAILYRVPAVIFFAPKRSGDRTGRVFIAYQSNLASLDKQITTITGKITEEVKKYQEILNGRALVDIKTEQRKKKIDKITATFEVVKEVLRDLQRDLMMAKPLMAQTTAKPTERSMLEHAKKLNKFYQEVLTELIQQQPKIAQIRQLVRLSTKIDNFSEPATLSAADDTNDETKAEWLQEAKNYYNKIKNFNANIQVFEVSHGGYDWAGTQNKQNIENIKKCLLTPYAYVDDRHFRSWVTGIPDRADFRNTTDGILEFINSELHGELIKRMDKVARWDLTPEQEEEALKQEQASAASSGGADETPRDPSIKSFQEIFSGIEELTICFQIIRELDNHKNNLDETAASGGAAAAELQDMLRDNILKPLFQELLRHTATFTQKPERTPRHRRGAVARTGPPPRLGKKIWLKDMITLINNVLEQQRPRFAAIITPSPAAGGAEEGTQSGGRRKNKRGGNRKSSFFQNDEDIRTYIGIIFLTIDIWNDNDNRNSPPITLRDVLIKTFNPDLIKKAIKYILVWQGDEKMDKSTQKKLIEDFGKGGGIFPDIFAHQLKRLAPQTSGLSRGFTIAEAINRGILFSNDEREKAELKKNITQLEHDIIKPALDNVSVFIQIPTGLPKMDRPPVQLKKMVPDQYQKIIPNIPFVSTPYTIAGTAAGGKRKKRTRRRKKKPRRRKRSKKKHRRRKRKRTRRRKSKKKRTKRRRKRR